MTETAAPTSTTSVSLLRDRMFARLWFTQAATQIGGNITLVPIVVVIAVIAGAAYAATSVSAQTALFESMPGALRGRIFGVLASIVSAASLIPVLIAGPLADRISAPTVIGMVGIGIVAVALLSARRFGPVGGPSHSA